MARALNQAHAARADSAEEPQHAVLEAGAGPRILADSLLFAIGSAALAAARRASGKTVPGRSWASAGSIASIASLRSWPPLGGLLPGRRQAA